MKEFSRAECILAQRPFRMCRICSDKQELEDEVMKGSSNQKPLKIHGKLAEQLERGKLVHPTC